MLIGGMQGGLSIMKHPNVAPSAVKMPRAQRGTVLAITLILLVILSLLGTFVIRNANQSERIMNGVRTSNVAQQAAETGLRFCEQLATAPPAGSGTFQSVDAATYINATAVSNANEGDWTNTNNWKSSNARLLSVPESFYNSGKSAATKLTHTVMTGSNPYESHWKGKVSGLAMPPNAVAIKEADAKQLVKWILSLDAAKKS